MTERLRVLLKRSLFLPPVLIGVAAIAYQLSTRSPPQQADPTEIPRPVRVIQVEPLELY